MKRKWLTKGISMILALSMTLGLCACGGNSAEEDAKAAAAKEGVYSCKELGLPYEEKDNESMSIFGGAYVDGRLYYVVSVYSWGNSGSGETEMRLYSMLEDGSDVKEVNLQLPEEQPRDTESEGSGEEGADSASKVQARTESVEAAVEVVTADIAVTLPATPEDGAPVEEGDMADQTTSSTYVSYSYVDMADDGQIYAVKNVSYEDWSDPNNYIWENSSSLVSWDLDGNLLWEQTSDALPNAENGNYVQDLECLSDGGALVIMAGSEYSRVLVDKDGTVHEAAPLNIDETIMYSMGQMYVGKDNQLVIMAYNSDYTKLLAYEYDFNTDTLNEGTELPGSLAFMGYSNMMPGVDTDMMYSTEDGIYTFNFGDTEPTMVMSFVNSDLDASNVYNIIVMDENRFAAVYRDYVEYTDHPAIFTKVNPEDIQDKQILTLAGCYVGTDVKKRIIEFNKSSEQYRITIKDYSSYSTMEDYQAGYTQLNNDIISGNMPDILVADAYNMPVDNYIAKGLLADIGKLLENDEELSKLDYLDNVFEAYSVDGVLYQVVPSFIVQTYIAKDKWVGDRSTWTMQDMMDVVASMPEGATAFGSDMTRQSFVSTMLTYCGQDFIDTATGKCEFDSEEFIAILEYANSLPEELADDFYSDESFWEQYDSQYREDRTLLYGMYMYDFNNLNYSINGYMGEDVAYVGFPGAGEGMSIMRTDTSYVISSKSKNIDGAWQFVREYLTEEYQRELSWGYPVLESVFLEQSEGATKKPTYTDSETGEEVEYEETFWMNGEDIPLEPLSQEQLDQVIDFLKSVDNRLFYNENVTNIIMEEAESYFTGQKPVEEVVKIIQSRAQIYVDENR